MRGPSTTTSPTEAQDRLRSVSIEDLIKVVGWMRKRAAFFRAELEEQKRDNEDSVKLGLYTSEWVMVDFTIIDDTITGLEQISRLIADIVTDNEQRIREGQR